MKGYYENTCLGCDLINSRECPHYPKNKYPGHHKNISSPSIIPPQICKSIFLFIYELFFRLSSICGTKKWNL